MKTTIKILLLSALVAIAARQSSAQINVLICAGDYNDDYVNDIDNKLTATGLFNNVDVFRVDVGTPTLALLQNYNAVLVYSYNGYSNSTSLGNVMAQYVDAGGGVVLAAFDFNTATFMRLRGAFDNSTYRVINTGSQVLGTASLGTVLLPSHPVMSGVSTFINGTGYNRINSSAIYPGSGAYIIAQYNTGQILVAARDNAGTGGNKRRVDINFFPVSGTVSNNYWNTATDGTKILANALLYVGCPGPVITSSGPTHFCGSLGTVTFTASTGSTYLWSPGNETTQSITVSAVGSYSVTVDGIPACNIATVALNPIPEITPQGPTSLCPGAQVTLTANTAGPWLWNTHQTTQSIVASAPGTFKVAVAGCTSAPVLLTLLPTPTAIFASSNSPLCPGNTLDLTVNSMDPLTFYWTGPDGFTSTGQNPSIPSITDAAAGLYTVTGTNSDGCTTTANVDVTVFTATLSGTYTVGTGGDFSTLMEAVSAYNNSCLLGPVIFKLTDPLYNEHGISINANPNASAVNTLTIEPDAGVASVITASSDALPIIKFNNSNYVILDGINSSGSSLTISNTATSDATQTNAIFFSGGSHNTVTRCTVLGSSSTIPWMIDYGCTILFSGSPGSYHTVSFCDVGPAGANLPARAILSLNTMEEGADHVTITNCNIFDFFSPAGESSAIYLSGYESDWVISNNKFYQTGPRTFTPLYGYTGMHRVLRSGYLSTPENIEISGNVIGFANSSGTGTYTLNGEGGHFQAIYVKGSENAPSGIQGNVIANISMTTTSWGMPFTMIFADGGVNIGNISGNSIGSQTGTSSISFSTSASYSSGGNTEIYGILHEGYYSSTISNNLIGSITSSNSATGAGRYNSIICLEADGCGDLVSNNMIGGNETSSIVDFSDIDPFVLAIVGIRGSGCSGFTATNNTVRNMTMSGNGSMIGIIDGGTDLLLSHNTVHSLINSSATGAYSITGISSSQSENLMIEGNNVHSLSAASPSATIIGITYSTAYNCSMINNMVRLGIDYAGNSITIPCKIFGWRDWGVNFVKCVNNSIYLGGSSVGTGTNDTYAFYSEQSGPGSDWNNMNNIFVNERSNSGTGGKHYAIFMNWISSAIPGLSVDHNIYRASGNGGMFGFFDGSDVQSLADWQFTPWSPGKGPGLDAASIYSDPLFKSPAGNSGTVDLHVNNSSPAGNAGVPVPLVTTDFDNEIRDTETPDIGADEFDGTLCSNTMAVDAGPDEVTYFGYPDDQTVVHTATVSGGTPPYSYSWALGRPLICNQTNPEGDEVFSGGTCANTTCPNTGTLSDNATCSGSAIITATLLEPANVCVTVTDVNGCTATDCFSIAAQDVRCYSGNSGTRKVIVCHHTNNFKKPWAEICVNINAVPGLLASGDYLGSCSSDKSDMITDADPDPGFYLYPNPARQTVNVHFYSENKNSFEIDLFDITGRQVKSYKETPVSGENTIVLKLDVVKGLYYLILKKDDQQVIEKLVVE